MVCDDIPAQYAGKRLDAINECLASEELHDMVTLKKLSNALMKRIRKNYKAIVGINASLIALGVAGVFQPTTSALLHNTSTLVISMKSMKNLLGKEENEEEAAHGEMNLELAVQ